MGEAKRKRKAGVELLLAVSLHGVEGMADLSNKDRITLAGVTIESPGIGPAVREVLVNQVRDIFDKHGPGAFESTQNAAAIHEAGHLVVHAAQGLRVKHSRIEHHDAGGWIGFTDTYDGGFHFQPASAAPEEMLRLGRNLCAGVLAEELFDPNFCEASSIDEVIMSQLVGAQIAMQLNLDGERHWKEEIWGWTCKVLRSQGAVVAAIAGHLFAHQTLCGEPLEGFCNRIREQEAKQ